MTWEEKGMKILDQNGKGCLHVRHGLLGGSQWFIPPFGVPAD
jgi:hypothetical protein